MLLPNIQNKNKNIEVKLDISDRDRYYFNKMGMYNKEELIDRNPKVEYIKGHNYRERR